MSSAPILPPALLRRAFCFLLLASPLLLWSAVPPRPDAAQAGELLRQFREAGVPGQYYLEFELRALPRRGEERQYRGRLWGTRNAQGPVTRVEVTDESGLRRRFLLQGGPRAAVWRSEGGVVTELRGDEVLRPVVPGVELTPFDLQMPFLYWDDATLLAPERVRGRAAHAFVFKAPPGAAAPSVAAARVYLDAQFNALLQYDLLDARGSVLRSFALVSLKTIEQRTLPKTVDFRNEVTRDKARLQFTSAALGLDLGGTLFSPEELGRDVAPPAGRRLSLE